MRRSTQENKLIEPLEQSISKYENHIGPQTKETQTEAGLLEVKDTKVPKQASEGLHITKIDNKYIQQYSERQPEIVESLEDESHEMTLDEKIEIFQKHLINGHNGIVYVRSPINENEHISGSSKRNLHNMKKATGRHQHRRHGRQNHHHQSQNYHHHRPYKERKPKIPSDDGGSPTSTVITPLKSPGLMETPVEIPTKSITKVVDDMENSNDSVAIELARLFSEEKTELDEIFGIDPNQEPDDPQICKILQEIEQAKVNVPQPNHTSNLLNDLTNHNETPTTTLVLNHSVEKHSGPSAGKNFGSSPEKHLDPSTLTKSSVDLSKSLWPCELFMQKRKLSESLARLIEEDLRWHDIIKWKFVELFGEDSDDEFTPCSPSIELDDVLMGSCVKRISLWVVKHLMKPMKHGLIGNRFVFKKLAKHIARSIITENQYPGM